MTALDETNSFPHFLCMVKNMDDCQTDCRLTVFSINKSRIFLFVCYISILSEKGFFPFLGLLRHLFLLHHNLSLFFYHTGNGLDLCYREERTKKCAFAILDFFPLSLSVYRFTSRWSHEGNMSPHSITLPYGYVHSQHSHSKLKPTFWFQSWGLLLLVFPGNLSLG